MGKLFQQESLSDVMLMAEGQSIPCHKFLLASASEYFYNKLVVVSDAFDHNLLEIEGISFQTLKVIVSYIYTGNINITVANAGDVIQACKMLKLHSACATCEAFLIENTNPQNCIGLYGVATASGIQVLKEKAREVMMNNFTEVVIGPEFQNMSAEDLEVYIQNENLRIPNEDSVFHAVTSWIRFQPGERSQLFGQLVKHLRFRFCSTYCLKYLAPKEPLLDTVEYQKIIFSAVNHQNDGICWDKVHGVCQDCKVSPRMGYQTKVSMIIIGGKSDPGDVTRTECWKLENDGWEVLEECPMPKTVRIFSACVIKDGIVVSGGGNGDMVFSQCWLLSTPTYQWSPLPDLNTARRRHTSVFLGSLVYAIAGEGTGKKRLSSVESLERNNSRWDFLPDLPKVITHPMAAAYGQCNCVFGGICDQGNHSVTVYVYKSKTKSWKELSDMPAISEFGAAVVLGDMIYIVGGFRRSCMSFDPALNVWTILSQCGHEHADSPALVWKDKILVCGGRSHATKRDDGTPSGTSVIEEFDPEKDTWIVSQKKLPLKLSSHFICHIE